MTPDQRQAHFRYFQLNGKIPADAKIEDYSDDQLRAFGEIEPPKEEPKETAPAVMRDFDFHLSVRFERVTVSAANKEDAEEKFLKMTLAELGVTSISYKIMNL